jgi:hypothetical protein
MASEFGTFLRCPDARRGTRLGRLDHDAGLFMKHRRCRDAGPLVGTSTVTGSDQHLIDADVNIFIEQSAIRRWA